ncbi:MAG: glycosyltransferase, partial [Verrucomicrobiota bacterium]
PPPRLSLIVPLYNCLGLTTAMLASLHATLPPGISAELLLVDDGSTDGTPAWLEEIAARPPAGWLPLRSLVNERNRGFAVSNNRAAALARGELLLLLNNDLVLLPGWLEPLLAAHRRLGARAGLVGNVQLDAATGAVDHAGLELTLSGKPVHTRVLPPARAGSAGVRIVPAVTGACVLLSRSLWEELGGFDEGYVNGGEDIDLGYRARAAGRVNAVARHSVVRHHVSSSPGRKARDEHNSRRLALRWRERLIADAAPAWCRAQLAAAWARPDQLDYLVTLRSASFLAGLRGQPPPEAQVHLARAMRLEHARWDAVCGQSA